MNGRMIERLKIPSWKGGEVKTSVGSNPTPTEIARQENASTITPCNIHIDSHRCYLPANMGGYRHAGTSN